MMELLLLKFLLVSTRGRGFIGSSSNSSSSSSRNQISTQAYHHTPHTHTTHTHTTPPQQPTRYLSEGGGSCFLPRDYRKNGGGGGGFRGDQ